MNIQIHRAHKYSNTNIQTDRRTHIQSNTHLDYRAATWSQTNIQTDRRLTIRQTLRLTEDEHTVRLADGQKDSHTIKRTFRRTVRYTYSEIDVQRDRRTRTHCDAHKDTGKYSKVEKYRYPARQTFRRTIAQTYSQTNIQILIQTERWTAMQSGKHSVGQKADIQ